jgi:hypothetical protein
MNQESIVKFTPLGSAKMNWSIGDKTKTRVEGVCKQAFCNAYCVSSSHVDNILKEIKLGNQNCQRPFSDHSRVEMGMFQGLKKIAAGFGFYLSKKQVAAAKLPNSPTVLTAYGWMARHFDLIGDMVPNSGGEIHLEPIHIVEVYAEHVVDMEHAGIPYVNVDTFANIWSNCFEHVKIREFKAVSGKCQTCANLSTLRRTFKSQQDREYVTMMHALHRSTYMGERLTYAERRNNAVMERSRYLSLISDGMAQGHNLLPYFANQNTWTDSLPQHLQGVLSHNRGMTMYRTFHNINNCANVAMYTFLDTLEKVIEDEGKLPDTVYHQIDGGSENTAKAWFALCELIVARRLCKKIVLTRLTVGHTHEDIDSKFGILWKKIRNKFIYTPQQYAERIEKYLSTKKHKCKVVDIFAIPDFKTLLDGHMDKAFSAQSKMEKTQLQWTFEAVTPDEYFVNGVRVFYRAYAADTVCQIIEDRSARCGVYAKTCDVFDYPMRDLEKGIPVDGMTVLTSLPTEPPQPYPFVSGSREMLDSVVQKVRQDFHQCHPKVVEAWATWAKDEAPASDNVDEYIRDKPLHVPLGKYLFSSVPIDKSQVEEWDKHSIMNNLRRMRTTDCVKWSRWNHTREDHCPENFARVELVENAMGVVEEVNALPEKVKIFHQWKKRKNFKADETGDFKFVLCRADRNDIRTALFPQGQLVALSNGGHRVYWKNKRNAEEFPAEGEDKSFSALMDIGWFAFGRVMPPPDGHGKVGIVQLTDEAGVPFDEPRTVVVETPIENNDAAVVDVIAADQCVVDDVNTHDAAVVDVIAADQCVVDDVNADEDVELDGKSSDTEAALMDVAIEENVIIGLLQHDDDVSDMIDKRRKLHHDWYSNSSVGSNNIISGKRCRRSAKKFD